MAQRARNRLLTAFMFASSLHAQGQILSDPRAVGKVLEVIQFGVPADSKFIFCDGPDCPERTSKTLAAPLPAPPPQAFAQLPSLHAPQLPAVLSRAKTPPPTPFQHKAARKKRSPKPNCESVIEQ